MAQSKALNPTDNLWQYKIAVRRCSPSKQWLDWTELELFCKDEWAEIAVSRYVNMPQKTPQSIYPGELNTNARHTHRFLFVKKTPCNISFYFTIMRYFVLVYHMKSWQSVEYLKGWKYFFNALYVI